MSQQPTERVAPTAGPAGLTRATVEEIAERLGEPDWLRERRAAAWRVFDYLPMPQSDVGESWRRTDVSDLDLAQFAPYSDPGYRAEQPADLDPALTARLGRDFAERAAVTVQHDSAVVYQTLRPDLAAAGVIVTDLATAAREYPDLIRRYLLTDLVQPEMSKFVALEAAFRSGGTFVYVPANRRLQLPIDTLTWLGGPGRSSFRHLLLVAEAGSAVTVIERVGSPDFSRPSLSSAVTEIVVGQNALVQHVTVQEWGRGMTAFARQRARVERDGRFISTVVALGGSLWRGEIETVLAGPGADVNMYGLVVGNRRQHLDHQTLQYHQAPHTRSNLLYKGVLRDRARAVFVGRIEVPREAQQSESYQANRNLLLTDRARADSRPILEIVANDVHCTHGATVGPLDEEQLFYLLSRGIPEMLARQMLVEGFVQPILDQVPPIELQTYLQAAISERVNG